MNNKTLAIIKPDAVGDNHIGEIISMINKAGFKIKALKMIKLSKDAAKAFYEIHKDRPFYDELVEYMTRHGRFPELRERLQQERPRVQW